MGKNLHRHFPKEETQMAGELMERCAASLVIRELQIKTTTRTCFIPSRMALIRKQWKTSF